MSTITRRATDNDNPTIIGNRSAAGVRGSIDLGHSANVVRRALSHNLCGWPAILPTRPPGVGDILYWTTPGAFQHGPTERTPDTPIHNL
jgi:hypothetical protein